MFNIIYDFSTVAIKPRYRIIKYELYLVIIIKTMCLNCIAVRNPLLFKSELKNKQTLLGMILRYQKD